MRNQKHSLTGELTNLKGMQSGRYMVFSCPEGSRTGHGQRIGKLVLEEAGESTKP